MYFDNFAKNEEEEDFSKYEKCNINTLQDKIEEQFENKNFFQNKQNKIIMIIIGSIFGLALIIFIIYKIIQSITYTDNINNNAVKHQLYYSKFTEL